MSVLVSRLFGLAVVAHLLLFIEIRGNEETIAKASSYAHASTGYNDEEPTKEPNPTENQTEPPPVTTAPTDTATPAPTETATTSPATVSNSDGQDDFKQGNLKFTLDFLNTVVKGNPNSSVIMSPFSLLFLLAQLALYAVGPARDQLLSCINLKDQAQIRSTIPPVLDSLANQRNITLSLAERVYGNINYEFSDAFKTDTKEIFKGEAENIDFSDPQKAADIINAWVAANTNNKIEHLLPSSVIKPNTRIILVNAIYFLGEWANKFNKDNTRPGTFYASKDKNVTIDLMHQVKYFRYAEIDDLDAKAVELPYVNSNLTFVVVLPNDRYGDMDSLTKQLTPERFNNVLNSLQSARVDLTLPKFNTTTRIDLKDVLEQANVTAIFTPGSGGLQGMLKQPEDLYVSAAIQEATIIVDEKGSEAAAANALIFTATSALQEEFPKVFNADHPILYYLVFQGTPIFCGLFAGN